MSLSFHFKYYIYLNFAASQEVLSHRNSRFVAAVYALQETSATENVLQCMRYVICSQVIIRLSAQWNWFANIIFYGYLNFIFVLMLFSQFFSPYVLFGACFMVLLSYFLSYFFSLSFFFLAVDVDVLANSCVYLIHNFF